MKVVKGNKRSSDFIVWHIAVLLSVVFEGRWMIRGPKVFLIINILTERMDYFVKIIQNKVKVTEPQNCSLIVLIDHDLLE